MLELSRTNIEQAYTLALNEWNTPNRLFTSGHDPRSSQNAILVLMHGGVCHAQKNDWLNAGRRLIDKTYVQILFVTQQLNHTPFLNAEQTAAALDEFIRQHIAPHWATITGSDFNARLSLAQELIGNAANSLFGSLHSEAVASQLLFYLCPRLPIFAMNKGSIETIQRLGFNDLDVSRYRVYADYCAQLLIRYQDELESPKLPQASYGSAEEIDLINHLLSDSDWWQRHILIKTLSTLSADATD